jgi:hypothetical protein
MEVLGSNLHMCAAQCGGGEPGTNDVKFRFLRFVADKALMCLWRGSEKGEGN